MSDGSGKRLYLIYNPVKLLIFIKYNAKCKNSKYSQPFRIQGNFSTGSESLLTNNVSRGFVKYNFKASFADIH